MRRFPAFLVAFAIGLMTGALGTGDGPPQAAAASIADDTLRIGLSLQPSNALVMVALDRGYFADEGLKVSVETYVSGTRALREGLFAGKVDVVTASDVPVVLNSFQRQDFSIIATVFQVDNQNRVVARRDRGIDNPADLKGKRVATQQGSAVHFFLHLFLLENAILEPEVEVSFMKAGELPEALARGDIDAFSMREPYISQAKTLLGDEAFVFAAPGLYSQSDQIVVANDLLNGNRGVAEKIVRALVKAERFVSANPEESQVIVAGRLGASLAEIGAIWPDLIPRVSLEQSLLLRLEDIGRWAVRSQLVDRPRIPNFLDLIYFEALRAVKPAAVTVIH